jgi:hypothetical protein
MRVLLVAAVLLGAAHYPWVQPLGTEDVATLKKAKDGYRRLYVAEEFAQAMMDSIPDFVIMSDSAYAPSLRKRYPYGKHSAPFALVGHVNKDRVEDVVLDGHEGRDRVLYACLTDGGTYQFLELERRPGLYRATGNDSCLFWQSEMLESGTGRFGFGRPGSDLKYYWRWSLSALRKERHGVPLDVGYR